MTFFQVILQLDSPNGKLMKAQADMMRGFDTSMNVRYENKSRKLKEKNELRDVKADKKLFIEH